MIAVRAPFLDSLLSRGSAGGRFCGFAGCTVELVRDFRVFAGCTVELVRDFGFAGLHRRLVSPFSIGRAHSARVTLIVRFSALDGSVVFPCGICIRYSVPLVHNPGFVRSHSFACSIIRIVAAHSARLSVALR